VTGDRVGEKRGLVEHAAALAGAATIARPCVVAPVFVTAKVTLPAFTDVLSALTNISPSVVLTSAFMAIMSRPTPGLPRRRRRDDIRRPRGVQDARGALDHVAEGVGDEGVVALLVERELHPAALRELIDRIRDHIRIWLR